MKFSSPTEGAEMDATTTSYYESRHPKLVQVEAMRAGADALELRADTWHEEGTNYGLEMENLCESFAEILRETADEIAANILGDPNPGPSIKVPPTN